MVDPLPISATYLENAAALGSGGHTHAPAEYGTPNEGGIWEIQTPIEVEESALPPRVTRGESFYKEIITDTGETFAVVFQNGRPKLIELPKPMAEGVATAALVDFLNSTAPFPRTSDLSEFFGEFFSVVGSAFAPAIDRGRGIHWYERSFSLGESKGIFAYGGNNQTALLSLPGEACHQIPDWPKLVEFLRDYLGARISRLDCAVDDFQGKHSVDDAVAMYQAGLFNAGGRKPKIKQSGNWLEPDGSGRTFYVGSRRNGKLLRAYEKGMQLGIPWHPWVRWEVELHNIDRVIPWDAVLEPGKYVAGAYPKALGWVSEEQARIRTLSHTARIGYDALTHWHSLAYGKHIDVMMAVEGTAEKVVERLRRPGFPARLDLPPLPDHGKVYPPCEP